MLSALLARAAFSAAACVLVAAGPLSAQDVLVREVQQLDTSSTGIGLNPSLASSGQLLAISYYDGGGTGSQNVYVSTTDGRGTDWVGPTRVDTDTTAASKIAQFDNCAVLGNHIYVVWKDSRTGSANDAVYFNRSLDGGATFGVSDVRLDNGYAPGLGDVQAWRFAASPGAPGGHHYLYVLMTTDTDSTPDEELFLVVSPDSGATWSPAFQVAGDVGAGVDVDTLALDAEGPVAHIMWDDDSSNIGSDLDSVYYRRFDMGTLLFDTVRQLDSSDIADAGDSAASGIYSFEIDVEGDLVACVWLEERGSATDEEVRVAWSFDGGDNFFTDELVGGYDIGAGQEVDFCDVLVSGDNIVVAYTDNRDSGGTLDDVYVSVLEDAATLANTWVELGPLSGVDGGAGIRLAGGNDDVGLSWTTDASGNQHVETAFSQDGGLTWSGAVVLSNDDGSVDADIAEIGYNRAYGNFVNAWLSNDLSTNNVFASGFRPATLTPHGWVAGATTLNFDFDRLLPAAQNPMGVVILSASLGTGSFVLPDGRDLGISFDALTQVGLDVLPLLLADIDSLGSGSTMSLPVSLPTGFTIYAVGLGFALDADHVRRVTDVVPISF